MKKNELFARGKLTGAEGNRNRSNLWETLCTKLHADPFGPEKDAARWQKVLQTKITFKLTNQKIVRQ